jgi:hypothetical protein
VSFDPDAFVADCRAALLVDDPAAGVSEVVAAAVKDGPAIDAALGTENASFPSALFESPDLTVQRITWWPGYRSLPHEHRMWAVVGVYEGVEVNRRFERSDAGIEPLATHDVGVAEVIVLDETAVHSVENPLRTRTAGLHVYGGDILVQARSAWAPDGREQPFDEHATAEAAMFGVVREAAAERSIDLDDATKYAAMRALVARRERVGRYLADDEARRVVTDAWDTLRA